MKVTDIENIKIADFDYPLPDERIPRHPMEQRDTCKLLVSDASGEIRHRKFSDLPEILPSDSLLVCNDTRVINARIKFEKSTGSKIEVFLLEPLAPSDYVLMFQSRGECRWGCLVGNLKRWKDAPLEKELQIDGKKVLLKAEKLGDLPGNGREIRFSWDADVTFASVVDAAGFIPIPPYLKRESESSDADDYQTVYARVKGSVAAPTAGLHFTDELFARLRKRGVRIAPVTLHVGAGTFQPVKSETIGGHPMHTEVFTITRDSLESIIDAKRSGRAVTAVGTTSVRTIESLPYMGAKIMRGDLSLTVGQWDPYDDELSLSPDGIAEIEAIINYLDSRHESSLTGSTSIMIAPGFGWRVADILVTNFHQPQSTLLLLVSAFLNRGVPESGEQWKRIYEAALAEDYRFLSYGDGSVLFPVDSAVHG